MRFVIRVWIPRFHKVDEVLKYDHTHPSAGVFLDGTLYELWHEQRCDCPGGWPKFSDPDYWKYPRKRVTYPLSGRSPLCLQKQCLPRKEFSTVDLFAHEKSSLP